MVVDDDDFVSSRLAGFAARDPNARGWYIMNGYMWSEGSGWLFRHPTLHQSCGTTHILHRDLMKIPSTAADAPLEHVRWLGTHARIVEELIAADTPLQPLPFHGSVYRVGHGNAHSQMRSVWHSCFMRKGVLLRPHVLAGNLTRLRRLTLSHIGEFGMARAVALPM